VCESVQPLGARGHRDADAIKFYLLRGGAAKVLVTSNAMLGAVSGRRSESGCGRRRSVPII
jgi:hypothetical protein